MQVSIRQNYQKFIVPPPLVGQDKTQVKLGMVLSQIMDIRSVAEENLTNLICTLIQRGRRILPSAVCVDDEVVRVSPPV